MLFVWVITTLITNFMAMLNSDMASPYLIPVINRKSSDNSPPKLTLLFKSYYVYFFIILMNLAGIANWLITSHNFPFLIESYTDLKSTK